MFERQQRITSIFPWKSRVVSAHHQNIAHKIPNGLNDLPAKQDREKIIAASPTWLSIRRKQQEENMSGESILITLSTTPGGPSSFPVVLKKVMELPPPNILDGDDGTFRGGSVDLKH